MLADVILPLAVPGRFTFRIPEGADGLKPGMRVAVPFGRGGKLYGGIVRSLDAEAPPGVAPREIISVIDQAPIVTEHQLRLWDRIADHYLCTLGEVMIAALPGQFALSSETRILVNPFIRDEPRRTDRSAVLIDALLEREALSMREAGELLGLKDPMPAIKRLLDEGVVVVEEELREAWKPRTVTYVKLTEASHNEEALHAWFDKLEKKAPKQLHLLMRYVELSRCMSDHPLEVEKNKLLHLSGATPATLKPLIDKGLFETYEREAGMPALEALQAKAPQLSPAQDEALRAVRDGFAHKDVALLRGVTSSGKTELYTTLIDEAVRDGGQVLYLLPEIALTAQIIERLRARFGERIAVYHSRMAPHERAQLWMRMVQGSEPPPIIVGARSALFLPFRDLRLVVVDEEHDPSYKQHEPAPRYHARDMAIVLAGLHGAKTLLGSATPSIESRYNTQSGKYAYAELLARFGDVAMPAITVVDLRDAARRKQMRGHFSQPLIDAIDAALKRREQAILFQNRRGYVPVWQCESCAWVPGCDHCDVSLTYHKKLHQLRCHYCGRNYPPPVQCGQCGSNRLRMIGFGTEKIEEELAEIFPEARIARMDQDTVRGRQALDRILTGFAQGAIDILVGTQMVTKGLDFDHVSTVGILNADALMRFPDFRAHERAFQLMAQVAGRAGRRDKPGNVIIQAYDAHSPVLELVTRHDVEGFYHRELDHRRAHGYPPFTRVLSLNLRHRDEERVAAAAGALALALRERLGERVLGPDIPAVAWVRDRHIRNLLVKLRRSAHHEEKLFVRDTIDRIFAEPAHRAVQLVADVDPV
ncbi:MAG: primosomal protein N' [Flavobacteriales bacterium]|nr:MAG: primosomal protein N' [Flavobacteriales bacterium]